MRKPTKLLLALLLASPLCSQTPAQRDWARYPPLIATSSGGADIYAIGDAHSDYLRLSRVLKAAGITDEKQNWAAGQPSSSLPAT